MGKEIVIRDDTRGIIYLNRHITFIETNMKNARLRQQKPRTSQTSIRRVVNALASMRYGGVVIPERGDSRWPRRFSEKF